MRRPPLRQLVLLAVPGLALAGCLYRLLYTRTADASALTPFAGVIGRDLPLLRELPIVQSLRALVLPLGTLLRLDAARLLRGGPSGTTRPSALGTVTLTGLSHAFESSWGERRSMNADGSPSFGPPLRSLFPQAPRQCAADPAI